MATHDELSWESLLSEALTTSDERRTATLSTICFCANRLSYAPEHAKNGLPTNRPPRMVVQEAAAELVRLAQGGVTMHDALATTIGLAFLRWHESIGPADLERLNHASSKAESVDDRLFAGWISMIRSEELFRIQQRGPALAAAERAVELVRAHPAGQQSALFDVVDHRLTRAADPHDIRSLFLQGCLRSLAFAARDTGDLARWRLATDERASESERTFEVRPSALGLAFSSKANLERALGDTADLTAMQTYARQSRAVSLDLLAQRAANAQVLGDYDAVLTLQHEKVVLVAERIDPALLEHLPHGLAERVRDLPENERRRFNSMANASCAMGRSLIMSGRTEESADDRRDCVAWLDAAAALWSGWASNGMPAVMFERARLQARTRPDVARDHMIDVAREATLPALRANAIYMAATEVRADGAPALAVLDEMLTRRWASADELKLLAARAWLTRPGSTLHRLPGQDVSHPTGDVDRALALYPETVPARLVEAWTRVQWVASLVRDGDAEVDALIAAAHCVVRRLQTASTSQQRRHQAVSWAELIRRGLGRANDLQNPILSDVFGEVIRRDGIGVAVAQALQNPTLPKDLQALFGRSVAAEVASEEPPTLVPDEESDGPVAPDPGEHRLRSAVSDHVSGRREAARAAARSVLGPLGRVMDPTSVLSAQAGEILTHLAGRTEPTFILQIVSSAVPLVRGSRSHVHRRLTWSEAGVTHELIDTVPAPAVLVDDTTDEHMSSIYTADSAIPEVLRQALARATPQSPVRLLIIPTGLYHVPWNAVLVDGIPLVRHAIVSVHTSLTAMRHQLLAPATELRAGSIAILDGDRLPSTRTERSAIQTYFPEVTERQWQDALSTDDPSGSLQLFALGVHGSDDEDGWAQYKQIPGHGDLTAAQALSYRYPELCVLASCHSRVGTSGDIDLAGFPTALFARGARTIVGSIGVIPDVETSEILARFYAALHASHDPVAALRIAVLQWLGEHPSQWRHPDRWGRLLVYGGAHL